MMHSDLSRHLPAGLRSVSWLELHSTINGVMASFHWEKIVFHENIDRLTIAVNLLNFS
jgi:hypothetical protein